MGFLGFHSLEIEIENENTSHPNNKEVNAGQVETCWRIMYVSVCLCVCLCMSLCVCVCVCVTCAW